MIVPLWVALPALLAAAALGWALERALHWELAGALAWPVRAALGMALAAGALMHPLASLTLLALFVIERRGAPPSESSPARDPSASAWIVLGVAALAVVLRPPAPLAWDEHVWLAKVRLGPLALREAALDPEGGLVPRGYPILASLAESLFAFGRDDVPALVAGAAAFSLVALGLAVVAIPSERRIAWALALAIAPLVWVHARTAYLDLPVGLLAVTIAAALARRERWAVPVAMIAAFLAAGTKDEGALHAIAIAGAHAIVARERWRPAALVVASALVAALGWRALIALGGVTNADHALAGVGFARAPEILGELARAAWDLRSWGLAWPVGLGCALAARSSGGRAPSWSLALAAQLVALVLGVLMGGERLVAFALGGTLANRVWMQLVPLAALVVAETIAQRAPSTSKTAQGCHSG